MGKVKESIVICHSNPQKARLKRNNWTNSIMVAALAIIYCSNPQKAELGCNNWTT
jgi:hypothetical protein